MTYEVIDNTGTPLEAFDSADDALACYAELAEVAGSDDFAVLAISDSGEAVGRIDQAAPSAAIAR